MKHVKTVIILILVIAILGLTVVWDPFNFTEYPSAVMPVKTNFAGIAYNPKLLVPDDGSILPYSTLPSALFMVITTEDLPLEIEGHVIYQLDLAKDTLVFTQDSPTKETLHLYSVENRQLTKLLAEKVEHKRGIIISSYQLDAEVSVSACSGKESPRIANITYFAFYTTYNNVLKVVLIRNPAGIG